MRTVDSGKKQKAMQSASNRVVIGNRVAPQSDVKSRKGHSKANSVMQIGLVWLGQSEKREELGEKSSFPPLVPAVVLIPAY